MTGQAKLSALLAEMRTRGHLPALDANVSAICNLTGDPLTCAAELTSVILRDAALTTNVISTANSSTYSPADPVKTVSTAILLMGFEKVRTLAMGLGIVKQLSESAQNRNLYRLFACSYFAGLFSRALGQKLNHENPEEMLVAGVLSQLPRLLLAHSFSDRYEEMESLITEDGKSLEQACQQVFEVSYQGLTEEIAHLWNIPSSVTRCLQGRNNALNTAVRQASQVADMMFGNSPGSTAALSRAERDLRLVLKNEAFDLNQFIVQACEADPNVGRFFQLTPKDVDMMVKIVEWGRVSPAEVAAKLTFGAAKTKLTEKAAADPAVLMGNYLAELMVSTRRGVDINRILLTGLEAVFRCARPGFTLLAFRDPTRQHFMQGRFFLGGTTAIRAADFHVDLQDETSPIVACLKTRQPAQISARRQLHDTLLNRLELDALLLVPVLAFGNVVGLCVAGRDNATPFTGDEQMWAEAVMGHIGLALERNRPAR
jgi:HD-like signal output (HDOD) protein